MESIESVSIKLTVDSAHAASTAIYYSLQCRADFLLETHLPSLTRDLARAVDDALRGAYTKAFGFDILGPNGQCPGERDPTLPGGTQGQGGGVRLPQHRTARGFSEHPQQHPSPR